MLVIAVLAVVGVQLIGKDKDKGTATGTGGQSGSTAKPGGPSAAGQPAGQPTAQPTPSSPDSTSLALMNPVAKDKYGWLAAGSGTLDAKRYDTALLPDGVAGEERCKGSTEYNLSREWKTLTMVAGIDDSSADRASRLTISVDNKAVFTGEVDLGAPQTLNLDVSNGLRLSIAYANTGSGCHMGTLVLGEPTLKK